MQVPSRGDLGVEQCGDVGVAEVVDRGVPGADARRVDDRREVVDAREQGGQRVPVRRVAGRDRDPRGVLQFCLEFCRARSVEAATAGEHQVFGAGLGHPARDVGAECSRAAGDQHRAGRFELRAVVSVRADETTGEHAVVPDRDLVLGAGQHRGEPLRGLGVQRLGQVDQATPAAWQVERGDAAETPDRGLGRVHGLASDRDGVARDSPDRRADTSFGQRLDQRDRRLQAGHHDHAVDRAGQACDEVFPADLVVDVDVRGAHRVDDVLRFGSGRDDEPLAGRRAGGGDRCPLVTIPPGVHCGLGLAAVAPLRERLRDLLPDAEVLQAAVVDHLPELGVDRVGGVPDERLRPEPLPVERIRGQRHVPAAGVPPLDAEPRDPRLGERRGEPPLVALVAPQ